MGLDTYDSKRRFDRTTEPKGTIKRSKSPRLAFVVQKHHASSLHYDFRLELDGVLKSWAIPKGPSLNPHDHHLAVQVEDHPYSYRTFEGTIPKGSYGAGSVIVWDAGYYEPRTNSSNPEQELRNGLQNGHLTFVLHGTKLQGEFALVRMQGDDAKSWLLVKKDDAFASASDITLQADSILTDNRLATSDDTTPTPLDAYPKIAKPWQVNPMLCTLVKESFSESGWLYEIKWDGYRAIGSKRGSHIELYSRAGNDFSPHYPPVAEALHSIEHDVILDGEIVVTDDKGRPHFEQLQGWRSTKEGNLSYFIFDILWCDGRDVRSMPLVERKRLLKSILPQSDVLHYSDHVETNGIDLFAQARHQGLEGIVAKQAASPYVENQRGGAWLKIKTQQRQEVVIGGFTEPRGTRKFLGSLLVGVYDKGAFKYVGHSGGGIPDNQRSALRKKLDRLERKSSPFAIEPKPNAPVHWVRPEIVCEMSFSEWTSDGSMRHPTFEGLRSDKQANVVHKETAQTLTGNKRHIAKEHNHMTTDSRQQAVTATTFTHLDKVFFPKHGYTKGDIIDYYAQVASYILPYLKDRPHSLFRQPHGITGEGFFQKNMEHLPPGIPSADIYSESNKDTLHWIVGGTLKTLQYMVQLGTIEINPWNSRVQQLDKPDWLVIDLDPEGISFKDVVAVAQTVKAVCDEWKVPSYPKTSGKTGIHIFVPLHAQYDYEQAKNFAHLLALEINVRQPKRTSLERMPAKRPHKIYLDYLQNREGQTLAAPYSVRPTPDASVSTPLHWDEIIDSLTPSMFTIKNIEKRLKTVGDLWKPVLGKGLSIESALAHIEQLKK